MELRSVLVADDETAFAAAVTAALRAQGRHVIVENDAKGLTRALMRQPFDHVVLEPNLPGLPWWNALEMLHDRNLTGGVVIVTAYPSSALLQRATEHCVRGFLVKPVTLTSVLGALDQYGYRDDSFLSRRRPTLAWTEWECLNNAILTCDGNITRASEVLEVPRQTIYRKLRKHPPIEKALGDSFDRCERDGIFGPLPSDTTDIGRTVASPRMATQTGQELSRFGRFKRNFGKRW